MTNRAPKSGVVSIINGRFYWGSVMEQRSQSGHATAEEAVATAERLGKVAYETEDGRFLCVSVLLFEAREGRGIPMCLLTRHHEGGIVRDYRNWRLS